MPRRPLRPCWRQGCSATSETGACPEHTRPERARNTRRERERDEYRGSARARGYDSTWDKFRRAVLAAEPLCRTCAAEHRVVPAHDLDHIVPLRQGGTRLDRENVQPLCRSCHARKTAREREAHG